MFDIDKTLVKSSTGHAASFSEGFKKVYGIDATTKLIVTHGMTDQQIIIEVLKKKGLTEAQIVQKIDDCMKVMVEYFNSLLDSIEVNILNGVPELLEELQNQNFLMGLVTGNLEPIARGKMKKANLNHFFKLGGFGSDDISRTKLVKIAMNRAKENFDFQKDNNVFLVGDAPQDMNAGHEAGITTIGVATGIFTKEDLKNAAADYVVDNLQDKHKILNIISKDVS